EMAVNGGNELKRAFDDRLVSAGADDVGRGAFAKEERERVDNHRLSGTRFAGEDVEAWLKRKGDVRDDGEIADAQLSQHTSPPDPLSTMWRGGTHLRVRSLKSPQCSFRRSRLKKL